MMLRLLMILIFVVLLAVSGYFLLLPYEAQLIGAAAAVVFGLILLILSKQSKRISPKIIVGSILGLVMAGLIALIFFKAFDMLGFKAAYLPIVKLAILVGLLYFGAASGWSLGSRFSIKDIVASFQGQSDFYTKRKILDTSVIIDGRVADIFETGFIEGPMLIPQFVLKELQAIADSPDSVKRNRGRRGLSILRKMQKKTDLSVEIWEQDFPGIKEVDSKLMELAKVLNAKIITNDYNLNKVAQIRGVEILNINELANALKPVVLPGEQMSVKILREGKEHSQGVAYLDDGTMIVVDDARTHIDETVKVEVTSVLQTTAGKMIFAKYVGD
jgi:uncharacterized protein YacL